MATRVKVEKQMIPVRLPTALNNQLTEYLAPKGLSKNSFILGLINRELEKERRKEARGT